MIQRNMRLAFRNILKNKVISSINILGLAIGMMAVLLIFQYIGFEKSFDKFFKNSDRIQRLIFYRYYQTGLDKSVGNNYFIGQISSEKIPDIEKMCHCKRETQYIQAGEQIFKEDRTLWTDSLFFDIFSHQIVAGDKSVFMRSPDVAVITESTARKYFGNENPLGKVIYTINPGKKPVTIQGVIRDVPANSHLKFDIAISLWPSSDKSYCYSCNNTNTYFQIKEGSDPAKIASKVTELAKENFSSRNVKIDYPIEFHLQPVTDIHLHSNFRFEYEANGNSKYLSILILISLLILISAGFNYFNIYSIITEKRISSIGVRIINGATRNEIINEFVTEVMVTGFLSLLIAATFLFLLFPFFKNLLGLEYTIESLFSIKIWLLPVTFLIALSLISGLLLGLKIYNLTPVTFIRGDFRINKKKHTKSILLAGQFFISIVLIGCTIGAMRQIEYMQKEAFTMNISQTLVVKRPTTREFNIGQKQFQETLLTYPGISDIAFSTILPGTKNGWVKGGISLKGKEKLGYQFFQNDVSSNFFDFFNVQLLAGRKFLSDETNWAGGPKHVILNKEAALAFGEKNYNDIIGQILWDNDTNEEMGEIVGIIDGYFQNSLDQEVKPTIFNCDQGGYFIFIRINNTDFKGAVEKVKSEFKNYFKDQYFEYYFLDDLFNSQYKSHIQLFRCFVLFSFMALLITCLSLFALVMTVTVIRTKEIGIRKLNGARISEILFLLNRDFILLTAISYAAAIPAVWYSMQKWLQGFAYRIDLTLSLFALTGIIISGIVLITVSVISWNAATRNPVEALRYE